MLRRAHALFTLFYLLDAMLLTAFGLTGALPPDVGWHYALAGMLASAPPAILLATGLHRRCGDVVVQVLQALGACSVLLGTAALHPAVGGLMLMTMISVMATCSLNMPWRWVAACCGFGGLGAWVLIAVSAHAPSLPVGSTTDRLVSATWFLLIFMKSAAVTLAGTALRRHIARANQRLAEALARVEDVAAHDDLTALPNRRAILAALEFALRARPEPAGSVGVAVLDLDHFKTVNDRFGHAVGDDVLRGFARVVETSLRPFDQVGRYGGEEFLLVLQQVRDGAAARDAAERLCRAVEGHAWGGLVPGLSITASMGVAFVEPGDTSDSMIRRADAALYVAKGAGRNRVALG